MKQTIFILFVFVFLGCSSKYDLENRIQLTKDLTHKNDFQSIVFDTNDFQLQGYFKIKDTTLPLKIYIEGDGFAFVDRYTVSSDPTPINPIALQLATKDNYQNIGYIARPCQYIMTKNCTDFYWSDGRFSLTVIDNINQAIDILKSKTKMNQIELVGFSGGGAIAILVANMRTDVVQITTIAGNLNPTLVNQNHNLPPLAGSLNPIDVARKVAHIEQIHFIGGKDEVITQDVAFSFMEASKSDKIKINLVPQATHFNWLKILYPYR